MFNKWPILTSVQGFNHFLLGLLQIYFYKSKTSPATEYGRSFI